MQVNPSINIAIGNYGERCTAAFHNHFVNKETRLKNYVSFYSFSMEGNSLKYTALNNNSFTDEYDIIGANPEDGQHETEAYFVKSFVNKIYNNQINLFNQLHTDANFKIVNINLIFGSFEQANAELVETLVDGIRVLYNNGMISNVLVRCFVILSRDNELLKPKEEVITFEVLEDLKQIQKKNNSILGNIIFIDDKNTSAVSLDLNSDSVGLILNEFITYLMTNHYHMVGNLMNADNLSLGLGIIYFDQNFFETFFKKRIIEEKILAEQLDPQDHLINTSHYKSFRDAYLKPIVKKTGPINIKDIIHALKSLMSDYEFSMLSYRFLLSYLVGDFKDVVLKEPMLNVDQISLQDVVYQLIVSTHSSLSGTDIQEHKRKMDELDDLKMELQKLKRPNEKGDSGEEIKELQNTITNLQREIRKEQEYIAFVVREFQKEEQPKLRQKVSQESNQKLDKLQREKTLQQDIFRKQSFFKRLTSKGAYTREQNEIEGQIRHEKTAYRNFESSLDRLEEGLGLLLSAERTLQRKHEDLKQGIESLLELEDSFKKHFAESKLDNFLFIMNIVDKEILETYFEKNKKDLISPMADTLQLVMTMKPFSKRIYKENYSRKIASTSSEIIDFKVLDYLLKKYNHLELFIDPDIEKDIGAMKRIAVPFFNADNSYPTNNSHTLMVHHNYSAVVVKDFRKELKKEFSSVPQKIETKHHNKFTLLNIDVIPGFSSLVKYNIGKKRKDVINQIHAE